MLLAIVGFFGHPLQVLGHSGQLTRLSLDAFTNRRSLRDESYCCARFNLRATSIQEMSRVRGMQRGLRHTCPQAAVLGTAYLSLLEGTTDQLLHPRAQLVTAPPRF